MFKLKEVSPIQNKNTFWSRDIKVERQHRRESLAPNKSAIKLGVKAALELQEALAREGKLHEEDEVMEKVQTDQFDDYKKLAELKRSGLAANVLEDALFLGGGAFVGDNNGQDMMNKVIPGGAISTDQIPDEVTFLDEASLATDKVSLLDAVAKVGGLEDAGELLFAPFANDLVRGDDVRTNAWDDKLGDYGINHEDVAGAMKMY